MATKKEPRQTITTLQPTIAYSVAGRTTEIGTRMAIGAQSSDINSLVLHDLVFVLFVGLLLGLPLAPGAPRLIGSAAYATRR